MIKFLSKQLRANSLYPATQDTSIIFDYFKDKDIIAVDTETTGFQPHTDTLLSLQLGDEEMQFVIDATTMSIAGYKGLLENKLLIFQNAKFDLRFLYKHGIYPNRIYDTFLAEKKLYQGLDEVKKNLGALEQRYCDTNLVDKSNRGLIHRHGFIDSVIEYCAYDTIVLPKIRLEQLKLGQKNDMLKAFELENQFCLALAYTEYCGLYLDRDKWVKKVEANTIKFNKAKKVLDKYIIDNNHHEFIDDQLDLFSTDTKIKLNWNSDKQVKKLFKKLGINVFIIKKGVKKESVEAPVLIKQKNKFDIISPYLEYKKWEKDLSTYGYNVLKHINPVTDRIHSSFNQIIETGRISSGGRQGKAETINLLNIPSEEITKSCFTAQGDNVLINCDYTGQEQIILVNKAKDKDLISFYNSGLGDMHSYIAAKIYPEIKDLPLSEIKNKHKNKRQIAKKAGFAINYGGNGYTIANNLGISQQEGDNIETAYFNAFPGLKDYFNRCERNTINRGYILIDDLTGSKQYIPEFNRFKELHIKISGYSNEYWNKYRTEKVNNSDWYLNEKEDISYYYRWKGNIRRNSLNSPIQGTGASIIKIATTLLYKWIVTNNLLNIVLISNIIYDELLVECPKDLANTVSNIVQQCMEDAGKEYCSIIPLKAEPKIVEYWSH